MNMSKVNCPICNTEMEDEIFTDCPYCEWGYTGCESAFEEDEEEPFNRMTKQEAKKLLKKGLNVFGEPLPKKRGC